MSWWEQAVSDTIAVERIDPDHFQPKYAAIEDSIRKSGAAVPLGSLLTQAKRGSQPEYVPGGDVLVINSQHVGEHLINTDGASRTNLDFWNRKPGSRVSKFDILINSTGVGTIGRVNCVLHDDKSVVDNHVTVLRVRKGGVDPLYLAVFLNSWLGRQQTYKWQSGSSGQLEIYPTEIKRFLVIVPDPKVQKRIADQLQSAFDATCLANKAAATAEADAVALARP